MFLQEWEEAGAGISPCQLGSCSSGWSGRPGEPSTSVLLPLTPGFTPFEGFAPKFPICSGGFTTPHFILASQALWGGQAKAIKRGGDTELLAQHPELCGPELSLGSWILAKGPTLYQFPSSAFASSYSKWSSCNIYS